MANMKFAHANLMIDFMILYQVLTYMPYSQMMFIMSILLLTGIFLFHFYHEWKRLQEGGKGEGQQNLICFVHNGFKI